MICTSTIARCSRSDITVRGGLDRSSELFFFLYEKNDGADGMTLPDFRKHDYDLDHDSSPLKINSRGAPWFYIARNISVEVCVLI